MHIRSFASLSLVLVSASLAEAGDWNEIPFVKHREFQSVNTDGSSAYDGTFPIRFVGVVLNNTEDWLDPTPAYTETYQAFRLGGQSEFYVQAVDLDGTEWDPFPGEAFDDFGGTACWMGQNYGNLPWIGDPSGSYTDAEWTAELARLGLFGGDGVSEPLRAGDLVEIRARGGLHYKGKMNVNEQHRNDAAHDFEIVVLHRGYGMPEAVPLDLDELKTGGNEFIFDPARQSGGERYQATRVCLRKVWTNSAVSWSANTDIEVTDGTRTLTMHLGLNASFDGTRMFGPGEKFDVVGILEQMATNGALSTDGYRLLAMNAADFEAVPPKLAMNIEAGKATLRWEDESGKWQLQKSATLAEGSWSPVAGEPLIENGLRVHREDEPPRRMFFRLGRR